MANYKIHVGSITNAMRGKSLLEKNGIQAYVHRASNPPDGDGCGYSLLVIGNLSQAQQVLKCNGVRVVRISETI